MDKYSLGKRIRAQRQQLGISQEQLALRAGMTTTYLGLIERGHGNITIDRLEQLASALNVSIVSFFVDEPEQRLSAAENGILFALYGLSEAQKASLLPLIRDAVALLQPNNEKQRTAGRSCVVL